MTVTPMITVLIPCHSTEFLSAALESIASQTLDKDLFEVLVIMDRVDPASVRGLLRNSPFQFRVLDSPNPGIVAALNFGLCNTSAGLIARMDEDDFMISERLEYQKDFLDRNQDYGAVGGQLELINSGGETIGFSNYTLTFKTNSIEVFNRSPLPHPGTMYRRNTVIAVGGYRDFLPEDWDLWVRINEHSKIANLKKVVLKYRVHHQQLSRQKTYTSSRGAHFVTASHLARRIGIQDHPNVNESPEDWLNRLALDANFVSEMIKLDPLKLKKRPYRSNNHMNKSGVLKLMEVIDFLRKDFFRHLPILYRTFWHKIRI